MTRLPVIALADTILLDITTASSSVTRPIDVFTLLTFAKKS